MLVKAATGMSSSSNVVSRPGYGLHSFCKSGSNGEGLIHSRHCVLSEGSTFPCTTATVTFVCIQQWCGVSSIMVGSVTWKSWMAPWIATTKLRFYGINCSPGHSCLGTQLCVRLIQYAIICCTGSYWLSRTFRCGGSGLACSKSTHGSLWACAETNICLY